MTVSIWWDGESINFESYNYKKKWYCEEGFPSNQYFFELFKDALFQASLKNIPGRAIEVFFRKTHCEEFNALHKYCKEHKRDLGAVVY